MCCDHTYTVMCMTYFISGEEDLGGNGFNQELEEIIRAVLGNLDSLQPFSSTHFSVFPYKKNWDGVSKVMCQHYEKNLKRYPFTLILYLEKNMQNGNHPEEKLSPVKKVAQQIPSVSEPQSKRCKRNSPLEEALLKDLISDMETESKVSVVRLHMDNPHAWEGVKEDPKHADKKGTKGSDEQRSGVNTVRGSGTPGEVHPGTNQDMGDEEDEEEEEEEEEDEEEEGNEHEEDADPGTPAKSGILTRLASHIFPFSLFFRDP
ncbi:membrane-anchored junction protein [Morone saxatilis]|uniref:membrane-anchored junction protein n=1 Tax=Morone saxatilis TaxID=34816 RepID=UPI0015E23234|nr:membrane-anchored junction protein [Morone saxatilis]